MGSMSGKIRVSSEELSYAAYDVVRLSGYPSSRPVVESVSDMVWLWRGPWLRLI